MSQEAIVLGGIDYSDSSRIIWVLTPEYGRQSLMVKGARRARSKYQGVLETFNLVQAIYRKSRSGSLYVLREADLRRHFPGIRASLEAFWAASAAVELVREIGREEQESRALFELLKEFLSVADSPGQGEAGLRTLLVAFRWRLADLMGLSPRLLECIGCGTKLARQDEYGFVLTEGGLLCGACGARRPYPAGTAHSLSYQGLRLVYRSCRRFPASVAELPELPPAELEAVERLCRLYLEYHLGLDPRPAGRGLGWPTGEVVQRSLRNPAQGSRKMNNAG
ncbi:MAG: DNA repair protein RecO [Candidatus Glassbacteria bacterium]|nr:DNA repair protein RecO [Candidatus Glassbacteria bacterium]